ncbi:MAG: hypothetical protein U0793_29120 [Gemmataceae bacterium]
MSTRRAFLMVLTLGFAPLGVHGQTVLLEERFAPGDAYRVRCRVDIQGFLSLPPSKDSKSPASLSVTGLSAIDYDERILPPLKDAKERTVRLYRRMEFQRKVGDQPQETSLRPDVRRLVILRHNNFETPFSPDGPLLWSEIDLVRTDVFTPALVGLAPAKEVKPGDSWTASDAAMRELTDLEKLDAARLNCSFETVTTLAGRRLARVKLKGTIQGVGEDGPARHELDGYYLFDLESKRLSYLFINGVHTMLDKEGKAQGKIEGSFTLTREPLENPKELSDEALRGVNLEPNDDNTLLLMEVPELGARFLYPRRWRISSVRANQIALDDPRGSGLLITVEPLAKTPSGAQFLGEARAWLAEKKATLHRVDSVSAIPGTALENFLIDADVDKQRVWLDYYVARLPSAGATFAARLAPPDQETLRREVGRIARSLQINRK